MRHPNPSWLPSWWEFLSILSVRYIRTLHTSLFQCSVLVYNRSFITVESQLQIYLKLIQVFEKQKWKSFLSFLSSLFPQLPGNLTTSDQNSLECQLINAQKGASQDKGFDDKGHISKTCKPVISTLLFVFFHVRCSDTIMPNFP